MSTSKPFRMRLLTSPPTPPTVLHVQLKCEQQCLMLAGMERKSCSEAPVSLWSTSLSVLLSPVKRSARRHQFPLSVMPASLCVGPTAVKFPVRTLTQSPSRGTK